MVKPQNVRETFFIRYISIIGKGGTHSKADIMSKFTLKKNFNCPKKVSRGQNSQESQKSKV